MKTVAECRVVLDLHYPDGMTDYFVFPSFLDYIMMGIKKCLPCGFLTPIPFPPTASILFPWLLHRFQSLTSLKFPYFTTWIIGSHLQPGDYFVSHL